MHTDNLQNPSARAVAQRYSCPLRTASATAAGTRFSIGRPDFTRARISDDETAKGKPRSSRPRNGAGNGAGKMGGAPPGRGIATNSARSASSAGSRHSFNFGTLSAPTR